MNATNLYITVGAPGCGKSTWLNSNARGPIISRDAVRFSIISDGDDYFSHEDEVFAVYVSKIQKAIDDKTLNIYADATHLNEKSRNKLLDRLNLDGVNINYLVFMAGENTCIERNKNREGRAKVPESVIRRMRASMTDPVEDNKYKNTTIYYLDKHGKIITDWEDADL